MAFDLFPQPGPGDPAIRWQVMRDLLDSPVAEVETERARVATTGWGQRLLSYQDGTGTWAGGLYGPKWTSTAYTLLLLARCGLREGTEAARIGVERLWDGAFYYDGALTAAKTIELPEACITAMYVKLAYSFDYADARVDEAISWLLDNQLADGGWNCDNVRTGDSHSSFHTSISVLEAFAEVHRATGDSAIDRATASGTEFFLAHRLYKSHRTGEVVDPVMTRFSFPPRWHFDVLRGLDHFQAVGAAWDDRFADAVELLHKKQRTDGSWPLQQRHSGKTWFEMEQPGQPSRWNTLRALRVLKWAVTEPLHDDLRI